MILFFNKQEFFGPLFRLVISRQIVSSFSNIYLISTQFKTWKAPSLISKELLLQLPLSPATPISLKGY